MVDMCALALCTALIVSGQDAAPGAKDNQFPDADALLTAIEHSGQNLRSLEARIVYTREFDLVGDTQIRTGTVVYESEPGDPTADPPVPPRRRFGVHFRKLYLGARQQDDEQSKIFDGSWLLELYRADKQYVRRQVVPPGETFDPLRLGEGPFPIPIGQRKSEILARFDAELLPAADGLETGSEAEFVGGCVQLKLIPRVDLQLDEDFEEIRLWYRPDDDGELMPVLARTIDTKRDVSLVRLIDVKKNVPIDPALLDTTPPSNGWSGSSEPYRARAGLDPTRPGG